jgi:membrane protein
MPGRCPLLFSSIRSSRLFPFWRAYRLWLRHDCVDLSAAFAYHSLQSFLPILLIALSLAARILGRDEGVTERLISIASEVLPDSAMALFSATLLRFMRQGFGAGLLGVVVLLLTSSNAYLTLQRGADRLWWNRPFGFEGMAWQTLVRRYVQLRLKAIGLVSLFALFIAVDQLITNSRLLGALSLNQWLFQLWPASFSFQRPVSFGIDLIFSFALTFLASLLLLWVLPSRRIRWRPLIPGALLISIALTVLNVLLGRVLFLLGLRFQAYGVIGGVLVLTLWVWLVGVVLYYGQCLSLVLLRGPSREPLLLPR